MGYYGDFASWEDEQRAYANMMEEQEREDAEREDWYEEERERQSKLNEFIFSDKI